MGPASPNHEVLVVLPGLIVLAVVALVFKGLGGSTEDALKFGAAIGAVASVAQEIFYQNRIV